MLFVAIFSFNCIEFHFGLSLLGLGFLEAFGFGKSFWSSRFRSDCFEASLDSSVGRLQWLSFAKASGVLLLFLFLSLFFFLFKHGYG